MAYGQLGNTGGSRPPGRYGAYGKGGSAPGRVSGTAARPATARTASAKTRAAAAAKRTKQAIEKKAAEGPKNKMKPKEAKPNTLGGLLYRIQGQSAAQQKAIIKNQNKKYKNSNQMAKYYVKEGQLPRGFTSNSVSPKQTKVPIKKIGKK